jgi:heme O synthase-like polyprenyltransferase
MLFFMGKMPPTFTDSNAICTEIMSFATYHVIYSAWEKRRQLSQIVMPFAQRL